MAPMMSAVMTAAMAEAVSAVMTAAMAEAVSAVMTAAMAATAMSPRPCKCNRVEGKCYGRCEKSPQNDCRQLLHCPAPLILICVMRF